MLCLMACMVLLFVVLKKPRWCVRIFSLDMNRQCVNTMIHDKNSFSLFSIQIYSIFLLLNYFCVHIETDVASNDLHGAICSVGDTQVVY